MTDDVFEEYEAKIPEGFEPMNWVRGFGRQMGPLYEKIDGDTYVRAFSVAEHHVNGMGNCHGGMLMAFADIAFGHVVSIQLSRWWVTVRLVTDFMAPANMGDWVQGTGEIAGVDGDFVTVQGKIWTAERVVMQGTGTFKMLGPRQG